MKECPVCHGPLESRRYYEDGPTPYIAEAYEKCPHRHYGYDYSYGYTEVWVGRLSWAFGWSRPADYTKRVWSEIQTEAAKEHKRWLRQQKELTRTLGRVKRRNAKRRWEE